MAFALDGYFKIDNVQGDATAQGHQTWTEGVLNGMTMEEHEWGHLRVINLIPGERNRNMQLLEEVTFETESLSTKSLGEVAVLPD